MTTTIAPLVADQLVTITRGLAGYRHPETNSGDVPVFDGSEIYLTDEPNGSYLVIGWPGDPAGDQVGESTQTPVAHAASNRPNEEEGTIVCRSVGQTGDSGFGSPKTARDLAYAPMKAVDAQCRGTADGPRLGVDPAAGNGQIIWARVDSHSRIEYVNDLGACCEVTFTVRYLARI